MKTQKYIISLLLLLFVSQIAKGQTEPFEKFEYNIMIGLNIGGTLPLPFPEELRKLDSYKPGLNPTFALRVTRWLESYPEWGITSGIYIDYKGFEERSQVKAWQTKLQVGEGEAAGTYSGTFTGKNHAKVKNGYFTIPLLASYRPFRKWTFHLGGYFSWMHSSKFEGSAYEGYIRNDGPYGSKTNIELASFDFGEEEKNIDAGLIAGADWNFQKRFSIIGQLNWGLIPIFPSNFEGISAKMYNVFLTLGLSYKI